MTAKRTYLFYDLETSGLNKAFDQVLQFAAIRTDINLKEISRHEIFVTLTCDTVPSPYASITHHISIEQCQTQGIPEPEAIKAIHKLLNEPGTQSVGYNSLTFDDEFLRLSFHRHLLTPYTHQFKNDCGRFDLYPITALFYLYHHDCLQWPFSQNNDGKQKPSLKLEDLSRANELAQGQAHNAIVDVEATVALARKLKQKKEIWQYTLGFFNKQQDEQRFHQLSRCSITHHIEALLVDPKIGAAQSFQAPVLYLGQHKHYKNQGLWLRLDDEKLLKATPNNLSEHTWVIKKRLGDLGFLLPIKERFIKNKPAFKIAADLKKFLSNNNKLLDKIKQYHQEYKYPEVQFIAPEADLYQSGFLNFNDQALCNQLLQSTATLEQRINLLSQMDSDSLKQRTEHWLARYTDYQPDIKKELITAIIEPSNHPPMDWKGKTHLTIAEALIEINHIREHRQSQLSHKQQHLLNELEQYLDDKRK